ncbi:hypothetical protein PPYR_02751 [Photinus pyralis]|uniref:Ribosomal protein n=1 Tax=Photinus pyralis TaxID=7054 RepID=A0A1Y1MQE1_PHOPY|nr:hypothetical protein PPYR_02751 [Photinus pyralis]
MNSLLQSLVKAVIRPSFLVPTSNFHLLSKPPASVFPTVSPLVTQTCSFKTKGILKRRCKACYFIMRFNRLFVLCDKHPRHKQMQMVKKERNTWMLSHATQSKVRPW